MAPKKVFVIRHCDKPSDKKGDKDYGGCNPDGYKRANLLAGISPDTQCAGEINSPNSKIISCNNDCPVKYDRKPYWDTVLPGSEKPTKLLAAISKKYTNKKCTTSNRCCLILNPTAALYGLTINEQGDDDDFCDDQGKDMADHILKEGNYSSNDILIVAWEHHNIPVLINELGVSPKLGDWPSGDKNDRFDLVFIIDFSNDPKKPPELTIDVQNLRADLPGDDVIEAKDLGKPYDDPFNYNKNKNNKKKKNSLRTTQKYYDTNTSKKNNHWKIIIIIGSIILSIMLICLLIFFIKKLSVKK